MMEQAHASSLLQMDAVKMRAMKIVRRPLIDKKAVVKMFSDNAKTYIQLSVAALGLTLTFAGKVLHIP